MSSKKPAEPDRLGDARRDTERSRTELEATLSEVADRLNPKNIAGSAADAVKATTQAAASAVAGAAVSARDTAASAARGATGWITGKLRRNRD